MRKSSRWYTPFSPGTHAPSKLHEVCICFSTPTRRVLSAVSTSSPGHIYTRMHHIMNNLCIHMRYIYIYITKFVGDAECKKKGRGDHDKAGVSQNQDPQTMTASYWLSFKPTPTRLSSASENALRIRLKSTPGKLEFYMLRA